jgi:hypothetical protein
MKRITISSTGCVHRNRNKAKRRKKLHSKPLVSDQPTTHSDDYVNQGNYKGARVLKAVVEEPFIDMSGVDFSKGKVNFPTDNRIPVWSSSKLKNGG